MRIFTLIILYFTFSLSANAQYHYPHAKYRNDLMRQGLKGKIKSVTDKDYNAGGDSMTLRSVSAYDDSGNLVSFITYSPEGEVLSRSAYKYNDSGKLVEEMRYKADGTLNVKTTCKYDDRGNKTEEDNYDASGALFLKVLSKFDGKGNRIAKESYNEFGSLFLRRNSKYDEEGNEILAKEYDSHHSLKYTTTYEYGGYDEPGNWRQRTTYKNDDPATITKREIQYRQTQ